MIMRLRPLCILVPYENMNDHSILHTSMILVDIIDEDWRRDVLSDPDIDLLEDMEAPEDISEGEQTSGDKWSDLGLEMYFNKA